MHNEGGGMKSSGALCAAAANMCLFCSGPFLGCSGGGPPLTISPASLPNGAVETGYSQTIQASGGVAPYTWAVSGGNLPHNLQLNPSVGDAAIVSGTPDTAAQAVAFTIQVSDSANHSTSQSYSVSIVAVPDTLTLSSAKLSFNSQVVETTSGAQSETLTNPGPAPVVINSITLNPGVDVGAFSQSNNCGPILASGTNCAISVTFTPGQLGPLEASVSIIDETVASPHQFSLSGMGLVSGPNATLSVASLNLGNELVGTTSSQPMTLTLANYGTSALDITDIAVIGDFSQTNTCATSLASAASCQITVFFSPGTAGILTGTLSVNDNAPNSAQVVSLSGTGTGSNYMLTGYCFGESPKRVCSLTQSTSAQCPIGQVALQPNTESCRNLSSLADLSTKCTGTDSSGQTITGNCAVRSQ
jgi:hypothetical protein